MSENKSAGHDRLGEISEKIKKSKFTFHDLSRHKALKKGDYARSNMPFELGMDMGNFFFVPNRKDKVICMLDSDPHAYDKHLSDMSGRDILYHNNDPESLFKIIPDWLRNHTGQTYDSPKRLKSYYVAWYDDYRNTLKATGHDLRKINDVHLNLYLTLLRAYLPKWKVANKYSIS